MESILERFDLLNEQSGAATGTMLSCSGDIIKSISPIDKQPIGTIRCATDKEYQQIIVQAAKAFKTWRLVPAPKRGEIVRQTCVINWSKELPLAQGIEFGVA